MCQIVDGSMKKYQLCTINLRIVWTFVDFSLCPQLPANMLHNVLPTLITILLVGIGSVEVKPVNRYN